MGVHYESHYKGVYVCVLRYNLKVQNSYIVVRNDHVQTVKNTSFNTVYDLTTRKTEFSDRLRTQSEGPKL